MRRSLIRTAAAFVFALPAATQAQDLEILGPEVFLRGVPFTATVSAGAGTSSTSVELRLADGSLVTDTTVTPLGEVVVNGITIETANQLPVRLVVGGETVGSLDGPLFPGWISVLPPLLAILLALVLREVVTSLFAGIWLGCLFLTNFNPLQAIFLAVNRFGRGEISDGDHAAIVLFTLMLGGMVGIVTRAGGMKAIVDAVTPLATSRRRGQLATWLAGVAVFFDDYANSLVVGNTMRPLTDRLRISREKLAYIVDSTAAPVAAVFFISTWIGYEVSLIGSGLDLAARQNAANPALVAEIQAASPFGVFVETIPYLFYPLFALALVGMIAVTGRDFGPMLHAERRANTGGGLFRPGAQLAADMSSELAEVPGVPPGRWWNGAIPVGVLVVTVLVGLVTTGLAALEPGVDRSLRNIFGGADPYSPLLWGSILACIVGMVLATTQRILSMADAVGAWLAGLRAMTLAVVILVMAWSLGAVTTSLETASFLAGALTDTLPPVLLPGLVFIVAALMAFATGTSWATMAILLPLVVPLSVVLVGGLGTGSSTDHAVVFGGIGSVLAGAIMGDHCSPISDTTVLSSTASSCDHVDHVRTQLPYAVVAAAAAMVMGSVPSALGVPVWLCLLGGVATLAVFVRFVGKPVEMASVDDAAFVDARRETV